MRSLRALRLCENLIPRKGAKACLAPSLSFSKTKDQSDRYARVMLRVVIEARAQVVRLDEPQRDALIQPHVQPAAQFHRKRGVGIGKLCGEGESGHVHPALRMGAGGPEQRMRERRGAPGAQGEARPEKEGVEVRIGVRKEEQPARPRHPHGIRAVIAGELRAEAEDFVHVSGYGGFPAMQIPAPFSPQIGIAAEHLSFWRLLRRRHQRQKKQAGEDKYP